MAADEGGKPNWPKRIKLGAVALIVILALIILFQNNGNRSFRVLFWEPAIPPSVLLLAAFAGGVVTGALALSYLHRARPKRS